MAENGRDRITKALLDPWDMSEAGMSDTSGSMPYASLDLPELQRAGAVRITQGGGKRSDDKDVVPRAAGHHVRAVRGA